MKCELCSLTAIPGKLLCNPCMEMIERIRPRSKDDCVAAKMERKANAEKKAAITAAAKAAQIERDAEQDLSAKDMARFSDWAKVIDKEVARQVEDKNKKKRAIRVTKDMEYIPDLDEQVSSDWLDHPPVKEGLK